MKKLFLILAAVSSLYNCGYVRPDAGEEAVLIKKPFFFGHGGVEPEPVKTGASLVALSTQAVYVPTTPIQIQEHFDDLMSADGVPLDFDAVVRIKITDTVTLITKFGPDWYKNNVQAEFRNRVRQAVRRHGMNETAISTKAIEEIDQEVSKALTSYLQEAALPLHLIQMTVGKANPPDSVKNQRIETAAQEQRALTEAKRKLAEDARLQAEQSRAAADNAFRNAMNMSPEQYLRLEEIKTYRDVCGGGKCTVVLGGASILVGGK